MKKRIIIAATAKIITPNIIPIMASLGKPVLGEGAAASDDVAGREVVVWDGGLVLDGKEEVVSTDNVDVEDEVLAIISIREDCVSMDAIKILC